MFLLKIQWELFGLKAPAFSWLVSVFLIFYSLWVYGTHLRASRNRQRVVALAEKRLDSLRGTSPSKPGEGITRSLFDSIASVFDDLPLLHVPWRAIASCIVVTDKDREGRFWASEDIGQIVANSNVLDYNAYKTAPTVISGIGLLATFLAILVALLDVRLAQNRVQGLDLLVQGLSGKFLSSVVALACATLLIMAERRLTRPFFGAMTRLGTSLGSLLPRLVPAQIMSDLRTEMAHQASMFGAFDVDLKGAVKEGLGESVRSALGALEKMATLQDELNRFVRENDTKKQEMMTGQLEAALGNFGQSLEASLERMASKFDEALALNTHGQFAQISESLSSAAATLEIVNQQLGTNQYVLMDLVELARATTEGELEGRKEQTEHLTNTVQELMAKLQEKTAGEMEARQAHTEHLAEAMNELMEKLHEKTTVEMEARQAQTERLAGTIDDLVTKLHEKTAGEMAARDAQTEHLATVVGDLMAKLQEKTVESLTSVDKTLAAATASMSEKVVELSTQMAAIINETAEKSTAKASQIVEQAGTVSAQTAVHMAELVERHSGELARVDELRNMLEGAIKGLSTSLDKYGQVTEGLQRVAAQVNVGVGSLSQTARSIKEGQEAAVRVSASLLEQIDQMKSVTRNQAEVWDRIRESMVEYERVFGAVEGQAGEMLGQIARHLETYSDATERHFSNLALAADTLVSQATGRLSGSIEELSEQLDDLHAALGGLGRVAQARK